MEKAHTKRPDAKDYIKPYDDMSSNASSDGMLEKMGLLHEETTPAWRQHVQSLRVHYLLHTILVLTELSICFLFFRWTVDHYSHGANLRFTPVRANIEYQLRTFEYSHIFKNDFKTLDPDKPNHFNGPYSPELEEAWDGLMAHQNLRLTKEELGHWADDAGLVELPDGGYFGTLAVFHSLHCIRRIHHMMHREDYYPNVTELEWTKIVAHAEHCLDDLRQNIQCGADSTIVPFHWGTTQRVPLSNDHGQHECVNWDRVDEWTKARSFEPLRSGYLMHPTLGPAYPGGNGDDIGIVRDKVLGLDKSP